MHETQKIPQFEQRLNGLKYQVKCNQNICE